MNFSTTCARAQGRLTYARGHRVGYPGSAGGPDQRARSAGAGRTRPGDAGQHAGRPPLLRRSLPPTALFLWSRFLACVPGVASNTLSPREVPTGGPCDVRASAATWKAPADPGGRGRGGPWRSASCAAAAARSPPPRTRTAPRAPARPGRSCRLPALCEFSSLMKRCCLLRRSLQLAHPEADQQASRQRRWPTICTSRSPACVCSHAGQPPWERQAARARTRNAKAWRVLGCATKAASRHGTACPRA